VKACVKVDENFSKTQFNAELSKYLKNAPNIKDGYNWVKKQGKKLKITDSQKRVHMRRMHSKVVMKVALKTKVKACAKVMLFVFNFMFVF